MKIICTKRMGGDVVSFTFDDEKLADFFGLVLGSSYAYDVVQFAILSDKGKVLKTNNATRDWANVKENLE